jgi:hypothetical protein
MGQCQEPREHKRGGGGMTCYTHKALIPGADYPVKGRQSRHCLPDTEAATKGGNDALWWKRPRPSQAETR